MVVKCQDLLLRFYISFCDHGAVRPQLSFRSDGSIALVDKKYKKYKATIAWEAVLIVMNELRVFGLRHFVDISATQTVSTQGD